MKTWEERVQEYESKGCTRSDAQAIVDAESKNKEGIEDDVWFYPEQLGADKVINTFKVEGKIQINEYKLPKNWKEICVPIGKKSIHDVMEEI